MTVDYAAGESWIAIIDLKEKDETYIFKANDEDAISDLLYGIMGESSKEELSGVPTFMEASSWCANPRSDGDEFDREKFSIRIVCTEE